MKQYDVAVIGSGYSGTILARVLTSLGMRVAIIDSQSHPRFAIGESSTPIADIMLRRLGLRYGLDDLVSLSTWGGWQRHHTDLPVGRKRGFSYFSHQRGQSFCESALGQRSLLAAASPRDDVADTQWYRPNLDAYLCDQAVDSGATLLAPAKLVAMESAGTRWRLTMGSGPTKHLDAQWVIDASGHAAVMAGMRTVADRTESLATRTHCTFAHFTGVQSWSASLRRAGIAGGDLPFDCDDSAQHHLLGHGWMWMLRFAAAPTKPPITSVGYTAPLDRPLDWSGFPSIDAALADANRVAPDGGWRTTGRLQRYVDPIGGPRALMLPTAALTLDPLHSTGIAHGLSGVQRIAEILTTAESNTRDAMIADYAHNFHREVRLLDQLVSTAYDVMDDFPRFAAACMLYFAGAIACEERLQVGQPSAPLSTGRPIPAAMWSADDDAFLVVADKACQAIRNRQETRFESIVRDLIGPWNDIGLMDPDVQNRYAYTATK
ncbi:hypothetical protein K227x_49800 [Rubripirellula lacrimiformis]|uniref:Tryptophan halogenase n=1 Tax=Rubripirellula lacrimiformis TaxID=1930273 RepID=A0A517NHG5_9BACT|nr:hypothetical protein [Rubripirellula lacrimiformis]QDT06570.1 hypothetical protein K227x_49800 [Rubripirellula lacrimiformis]